MRRDELLRAILPSVLLAVAGWWTMALLLRRPAPCVARDLARGALTRSSTVAALLFLPRRRSLAVYAVAILVLGSGGAHCGRAARRTGRPTSRASPYGEVNGDILTLHNVRNFDYRSETDFTDR